MMKLYIILTNKVGTICCAVILVFFLSPCFGQDLHFTNYRNVQNFFNPALSGSFLGTYKVQAQVRTQFQNTYQTGVIGFEYNLFSPLNKNHWIGLALSMDYDKIGDYKIGMTGGGLGVGYHIPFGKKGKNVVSIGLEYGYMGVGADDSNPGDRNSIFMGNERQDIEALGSLSENFSPLNVGVSFKSLMTKTTSFQIGFAMMHLNAPNIRYGIEGSTTQALIGRRLNFHGNIRSLVGKRLVIEPAAYLSFNNNSDKQSNMNFQFISEYTIKKKGKWALISGLGYRAGDSANVILGMKTNKTQITFSFDLSLSDIAEHVNSQGAFELGGYHIFYPDKTLKVDPIIYCPRL